MDKRYAIEPYSLALDHVAGVKAYNDLIELELEKDQPDRGRIATLNAKLGIALKLAEVYANLAVADAHRGQPRLLPMGGVDYSEVFTEDLTKGTQ